MFCYKCGTKLPDEAQFCFQCGTKTVNSSIKNNTVNKTKQVQSDDDFSFDDFIINLNNNIPPSSMRFAFAKTCEYYYKRICYFDSNLYSCYSDSSIYVIDPNTEEYQCMIEDFGKDKNQRYFFDQIAVNKTGIYVLANFEETSLFKIIHFTLDGKEKGEFDFNGLNDYYDDEISFTQFQQITYFSNGIGITEYDWNKKQKKVIFPQSHITGILATDKVLLFRCSDEDQNEDEYGLIMYNRAIKKTILLGQYLEKKNLIPTFLDLENNIIWLLKENQMKAYNLLTLKPVDGMKIWNFADTNWISDYYHPTSYYGLKLYFDDEVLYYAPRECTLLSYGPHHEKYTWTNHNVEKQDIQNCLNNDLKNTYSDKYKMATVLLQFVVVGNVIQADLTHDLHIHNYPKTLVPSMEDKIARIKFCDGWSI